MAELMVEGPGAFDFLLGLGINSFKGFIPDRAKQYVPVTEYGHVIGDVILFYLAPEKFNLVGRAPTLNWLMYHGEGREGVTLTAREAGWIADRDGEMLGSVFLMKSDDPEVGKLRLEGKEYIVREGDVMHFRFNV